MPKPALFVVAAAFTGSMAVLGVVSIPNAIRAYKSAHPVALTAERAMSVPQRAQDLSLYRGVITIDPVTVMGDPNSSFRARLQAPAEPLRARSAGAACAPEWQTLRAGPTERRYRELCGSELSRGTVDTPDQAKSGSVQERLVAPTHQGLSEHVADPRAHAAERPPLQVGAPESR